MARADVIHLKNGKTIVADSTAESKGRIEYTIGENTFALPKSLVEKIDTGPTAAVPADQHAIPAEDIPKVREQAPVSEDLVAKVIHGGQIDVAALKAIENEGIPEKSAAANQIAANFADKNNNLAEAARYLQVGLIFAPNQADMLAHYASVLLRLGRNQEALSYAERATKSNAKSEEAFALLGFAYYRNDRIREAIAAWKKAEALQPDKMVEQLLARAERELNAESEFRQQASSHFVLGYEGGEAPEGLRNGILEVLETQYNALERDLGFIPGNSISIMLYTDEKFFDVTHAPGWSAALNDGKIRIPTSGLTEVTPELARVLKHELTHSFIQQITHGHVPQWLNEGVAQLEEPETTAETGDRLASLYASGHQVPLNQLERPFTSYSTMEAMVVYAEALAAAECIRVNYGMSDVARILQRLGQGEPIESALRNTIHGGYAELENEIAEYLRRQYGR
jgi:tetratricopeptide (TPR) repeat protein